MINTGSTKTKAIDKIWLSQKEIEAYLGHGADFIERLRQMGMPFYRPTKSYLYLKEDVDNFIKKFKQR